MNAPALIAWLRQNGWRQVRHGYWERAKRTRCGRIRTHRMVLNAHTAELQVEMTDWARVKRGGAPHWWKSLWEERYADLSIVDGRLKIKT